MKRAALIILSIMSILLIDLTINRDIDIHSKNKGGFRYIGENVAIGTSEPDIVDHLDKFKVKKRRRL